MFRKKIIIKYPNYVNIINSIHNLYFIYKSIVKFFFILFLHWRILFTHKKLIKHCILHQYRFSCSSRFQCSNKLILPICREINNLPFFKFRNKLWHLYTSFYKSIIYATAFALILSITPFIPIHTDISVKISTMLP